MVIWVMVVSGWGRGFAAVLRQEARRDDCLALPLFVGAVVVQGQGGAVVTLGVLQGDADVAAVFDADVFVRAGVVFRVDFFAFVEGIGKVLL